MSNTQTDPEVVKAEVRRHYAAVAEAGASCCSAEQECCCAGDNPYSTDDLSLAPAEAVASSRGCGNPIALAGLELGEIVLDLGSGGGLDVILASQRVGSTGFVYGLDMTDEMLDLGRRNALRAGALNVEFLKGDLESIPLPDQSVNVIISNCVVNLTPDKAQALDEAFRVLRPGGRLAISDIVVDPDLQGLPLSAEQIRAALSWAGCVAGALTTADYRSLLEAAGFVDVKLEIESRYALDTLAPQLPASLGQLAPSVLRDLTSRFTSTAISARRPKEG